MVSDAVYRFVVGIIDAFLWGGELVGEEYLPESGPAVFIANHLGPKGPIACVSSIPLRLYAWIVADMVDKEKAAAYLEWDFVKRTLKLQPPLSMTIARALSRITVPMLNSLGVIPAFQGYEDIQGALKTSVSLLMEGKCLLVCPEDNQQEMDKTSKMTPFKKGFARLGELFYEAAGERLNFYPVAVHESGKVEISRPVTYNPNNLPANERLRIKSLLEANIRKMYLDMSMSEYVVPMPY